MAVTPNFFIVGAPKCGTTALYEYLRPHPSIFMPRHKEPHYFASDLGTYPFIKTLDDYRRLFDGAGPQHLRVGEASVYYLRSTTAIANIRAFNPDAKLIAMFRNPVEMVHSLHSQLLYVAEENESDFEPPGGFRSGAARAKRSLPARGADSSCSISRWDSSARRSSACSPNFPGIRSS